MKPRRKQRLTLVVIPDVSRPVRRARISRHLLYLIPILIAIALFSAVYWHVERMSEANRALVSHDRRSALQLGQLFRTLQSRNETVAQLQQELDVATRQLNTMQQELERIRQLEKELRLLAGLPAGGNPVTISSAHVPSDTQQLERALSEIKDALLEEQRIRDHTPSLWPTKSRLITSRFGMRTNPFTGTQQFHSGIDIAGDLHSPVYAAADGFVEETGYDRDKGYFIILNHRIGFKTQYMHLSKLQTEQGDIVAKGEQIGLLGSTGQSTGPHLHYEVWQHNQAVNPQPYLQDHPG